MNRAALAARTFLVVALLPAIVAAGYAAYAFRHQPPIAPGTYRQFKFAPLISGKPTPGLLLGTYAPGSGADGLVGFDQAVGGRAALTVRYVYWGNTFPAAYVAKAAALGAETVVELEPIGKAAPTLAQIAAGAQDKWLRKFAHEIIAPQDHFILSFAPEMNGAWYQYGYGKAPPSEYVAAFRHVHDVLAATAAARLITYLWQPSAIHLKTPSPAPYWPGSKYVDEIGVDGYYFFPTDTFRVIFARTLALLKSLAPTTPILIGETAVGPQTGHQATDIADLFAGIARNHLLGLIWFNRAQHRFPYVYHQDWRLQDNPPALAGFKAALASAGPLAAFPQRKTQS